MVRYEYLKVNLPDSQLEPRVKNMHIRPDTSAPMSFILSFHPRTLSLVSWQKYGVAKADWSAPSIAMQSSSDGFEQANAFAPMYALLDSVTS